MNVSSKLRARLEGLQQELGPALPLCLWLAPSDRQGGQPSRHWGAELGPLGPAELELVGLSWKRQRSLLVQSRNDPQLAGLPALAHESMLVVPVLGPDAEPVAALLLVHSDPGAISKDDRLRLERVARGLYPLMPRSRPADGAEATPSGSAGAPPTSVLLALALLSLFLVAWLLAPETRPVAAATPRQTPAGWSQRPDAAAASFLQLVQRRSWQQSWQLLAPSLQAQIPEARWQEQGEIWLADEQNLWELSRRRVSPTPAGQGEATVRLEAGAEEGQASEPWSMTLRLENGGWRVAALPSAMRFSSDER